MASERMSMDERMTICNMSIEGGARVGYVNPDETTFSYCRVARSRVGDAFDRAKSWGRSMASDADRVYDDDVEFAGHADTRGDVGSEPWAVGWDRRLRTASGKTVVPTLRRSRSASIHGTRTRASDCWAEGRRRVHWIVHELAPLGSARGGADCSWAPFRGARQGARRPWVGCLSRAAEQEGLADTFRAAGFEWVAPDARCVSGMNRTASEGNQCARLVERNFKGRQGSRKGRTLLMSPAMVAAAAVAGEVPSAGARVTRRFHGSMVVVCRCEVTTSTPTASFRRGFCEAHFAGLEQHLFEGRSENGCASL